MLYLALTAFSRQFRLAYASLAAIHGSRGGQRSPNGLDSDPPQDERVPFAERRPRGALVSGHGDGLHGEPVSP